MKRSHKPSLRATGSKRAPLGAQPDTQEAAATEPATPAARTSEGPVPQWAPEASPLDPSPAAHTSQELLGSPPSPRSRRPLHWADPIQSRAWLDRVRASAADLAAAAREGSHRLKHRVLSRAELRRQGRNAERALLSLFDAAAAGLANPPAEDGERGE